MVDYESDEDFLEEVDGIEVRKYIEKEKFHFPSIVYELSSNRSDEVIVTIRDRLPEDVPLENIGFHSSYGKESWDIVDDELVFEITLRPDSTYMTLYAVRTEGPEALRNLFSKPEAIEVEPAVTDSKAPRETHRSVKNTRHLKADCDKEVEKDEINRSTDASIDEVEKDYSLVDDLVRDIQEGNASEESIEFLQSLLGGDQPNRGSIDARLEQLQTDIANLRAYTNALEEFLDENGSGRQIIQEFESRTNTFERDLNSLESTTRSLRNDLESVQQEMSDLNQTIESLSDDLSELTKKVDSLESDVDSLDGEVSPESMEDRIENIEEQVDTLKEFTETFRSVFRQ